MSSDPVGNQAALNANRMIGVNLNALVSIVDGMITAEVPFLAWPGVRQIWTALFGWITGYFVRAAQTGVTNIVIDAQIDTERENLSKALQALIAAEKTGNANTIKDAIQNYANAQSALIRYDGAAPH